MQLAEDASVEFPCSPHADFLVEFTPAGTEGGSPEGANTLGAPDETAITLSANSTLTIAFVGLGGIVDETSADIQVYGSVDGEVATYVGRDEADLKFSGSLAADVLTIDISVASAGTANYLRLVGISGEASIDAFEALQTTCSD